MADRWLLFCSDGLWGFSWVFVLALGSEVLFFIGVCW